MNYITNILQYFSKFKHIYNNIISLFNNRDNLIKVVKSDNNKIQKTNMANKVLVYGAIILGIYGALIIGIIYFTNPDVTKKYK